MSAVVADTHAILWYLLNSPELSPLARQRMEQTAQEGDSIYIPSISLVEITYLVEKGRLPRDLLARTIDALAGKDSAFALAPLDLGVIEALPRVSRERIPDMPDRIIAATALSLGVPLISRDRRITASMETIW